MLGKNESIILRVNELIDESRLSKSKFADMVGINPSNFGKKLVGKLNFTDNDIKLMSDKLNVRIGWLISGEGQKFKIPEEMKREVMIDVQREKVEEIKETIKKSYNINNGVPYYNVEFELGFDMLAHDNRTRPDYMIDFPPYNKADCWCRSKGNSMHPTISGGDIIALKKIEDFHLLINNEIYGIITTNGLRTIKRVKDNGDTITLIPDNKEGFDEQTIDKKELMHVFQVLGCIKIF